MKILMMTNTYLPIVGGVEESIQRVTDEFRRQGHKVLIVAPEFEDMPKREEGVVRIPALQKFNGTDFSVNWPIPGILFKLMTSFQPDVVHSHHPFLMGDMALRLCGQYSIPLVFTYHTMFEDYLHYLPFHNERIKRFVIELSIGYANLTDQVIVPSQSVYQILKERGVDVPVEVIPTGVDIKRFQTGDGAAIRRRYNVPNDAFVVGHLGRLTPEKNLEFLSESVAEFMQTDGTIHFMVVGKGSLANAMEAIFKKHHFEHRLHLTGILRGQDVIDAYHAMDVFAFTSYTETQGLVLAEAMAAGVPIVALDAPGARDIVRDGQNGRLVMKRDQKDFVAALSWCFNRDQEQRAQLCKTVMEDASRYSIQECAQKILKLYESVASSPYVLSKAKHTVWQDIMHRIRTEWDMAKNIVEASEAALHIHGHKEGDALENRHDQSRFIQVRRWLSRKEWSARLLNLKQSVATEAHPGLVMIQIDGFSKTQFQRALADGRMPFLKKLMEDQYYQLRPMYTGLPSSTPSVQGELFYGVKQIVPAFSFFDEEKNKVSTMYVGEFAVDIEQRLRQLSACGKGGGSDGLLKGGSSYSNVYGGGAGEVHFCAVKIGWDMFWRGVNFFKIIVLWITHLLDMIWIVCLICLELVLASMDCIVGLLRGENGRKELKFIPTRAGICILLRELVTLGGRMDMARGVPVVHMNFLGYDEQAHRRGPSSRFAHRALRGIDLSIEKIYRQAIHSTRRNYDVWIYSDHGQEDCLSYGMIHGQTVKETVMEVYHQFKVSSGRQDQLPDKAARPRPARQEHQGIQSERIRYLGSRVIDGIFSLIGISYHDQKVDADEAESGIVVTAIGPTGNIYLRDKLTGDERDQLARRIVQEAHVPVVMAPDGPGRVRVWNADGQFSLPEDGRRIIGEDHPYFDDVLRDLIAICHHPFGGAFTFMGWQPGKKPLSFPIENGAHAGPGTEETNAFALLPRDIVSLLGDPESLRTNDIRQAALRLLGKSDGRPWVVSSQSRVVPPQDSLSDVRTVRVMTYNVHSCIGMDGKISPERIARVIARHEPDIVTLQELDLKRQRTGGMDQPHIIAKELEMMYHFHPNISIEEEHYGNAVLSRYPIKLVKAAALPGLSEKPFLEPRGAIWCTVDMGGGLSLQLFNTHLGLRSAERLVQVKALGSDEWLHHPGCRGPMVLCGDFNALPRSPACNYLSRSLVDAQTEMEGHTPLSTWFGHMPLGRIDHVFISSDIMVERIVVSKTDLDKKASDHLPLIVDLKISKGK